MSRKLMDRIARPRQDRAAVSEAGRSGLVDCRWCDARFGMSCKSGRENVFEAGKNVLSYRQRYRLDNRECLPAEKILESVAHGAAAIAEPLSVVGAVLGHVLITVQSSAGSASVCVERIDAPIVIRFSDWDAEQLISQYVLTVDLVSLIHIDVPVDDLVHQLLDSLPRSESALKYPA